MAYKTYTCPIARKCGGCEWLAVPYPIQLRRKQEAMEELFGEMVAADDATLEPIRGMAEPLAFRYKAATPFAPGPRGRVRSGFYEAGTHRIVACQDCLVEPTRAREALNAVARVAERLRIPAYSEDRGTGVLRHAVIRLGYATDDALLTVVTNGDDLPSAKAFVRELRAVCPWLTSIVQNMNDRRTNAILGWRNHTLFGPGIMHDELLGCRFQIGPTSFYQTNPAQTEVLYQAAIEGVLGSADGSLRGGLRVLDAYCGCGTIGICLAAAATTGERGTISQVVGIEQVKGAVEAAKRNAEANGLAGHCSYVCADATAWLARHAEDAHFDAVVLDPPRAGSTPEFLHAAAATGPERIVYVSCNPQTQVRDLAVLRAEGFRLERIVPVDMFPHTKHVETVVLLSKAER